jgi:hypothetical protein
VATAHCLLLVMIKVDYHVKYFMALVAVGVAMCLVGYQSYKGQSVKTLLIQNTSRLLQTAGNCEPGTYSEIWSPCYADDIFVPVGNEPGCKRSTMVSRSRI